MDTPVTNADLAHRLRLVEIQVGTVLWLSAVNLIANILTIGVAFLAVS
jgi:hypothetical protein